MSGSPSKSLEQLTENDEPADMYPELGQSEFSELLEKMQQAPEDSDVLVDEIWRAPIPGSSLKSLEQLRENDEPADIFSEFGESEFSDFFENMQLAPEDSDALVDERLRAPIPGSSSESLEQPRENNEPADMFSEPGQSESSGFLEAMQQEPYDAVKDEIIRAPVVRHDESGDELFRVSFATEADLAKLSEIYADVSMEDRLACWSIKPYLQGRESHLELGRFYYGQAFAAKDMDVVLKVTNQDSGYIVGCAWLQLLPYAESGTKLLLPWQPGSTPPECIRSAQYPFIYRLQNEQVYEIQKEQTPPLYRRYFAHPHYKTQEFATDARGQYANYCVPASHQVT